jgi:hypothetical protein
MNGQAQIIPVDTPIDDYAAGDFKQAVKGTSQIALQFLVDAEGNPKVSLHGSNDNQNWDVYDLGGGATELEITAASDSIIRDTFPHEYLAVSVNKNGSSGTISCIINIKEQTI